MSIPGQRDIELPLLRVLDDLGGKAKPADIYPRLRDHFPSLTDADQEVTLKSGANKWRNCIAWVRQKLISQGEMQSLARGLWAITAKGHERLDRPGTYKSPTKTQRQASQPAGPILKFIENLLPATAKPVLQEARERKKPAGDVEGLRERCVAADHGADPDCDNNRTRPGG